jgi:branched-chain amino acid transport system substrate-binding protein
MVKFSKQMARAVAGPREKRASVRVMRVALICGAVAAIGLIVGSSALAGKVAKPGGPTAVSAAVSPSVQRYAKYVGTRPGAANPKLAPVKIGFATDGGGSIIPLSTQTVVASQWAVNYINKYLGGVDGHPLQLSVCTIKNSESEGAACADQFLNDKKVVGLAYGSTVVGANTINSIVAGKKPLIIPLSFNPSDTTSKNTYILFPTGTLAFNTVGTFVSKVLHAKTMVVLYPDQAGEAGLASAIKDGAVGVKTKVVAFNPVTKNLLGAMTAAGAAKADVVVGSALTDPGNCLAFAKAASQLGINASKLLTFTDCLVPSVRKQFPGGDYLKSWYQIAEAGDNLVLNADGKNFLAALTAFKLQSHLTDPFYVAYFSGFLTIDKWLNAIGYSKVSPQTLAAQAKAFKGPLIHGPAVIQCDKYSKLPNACADGAYFFKYLGNNKYQRYRQYLEPLPALQRKYGLR